MEFLVRWPAFVEKLLVGKSRGAKTASMHQRQLVKGHDYEALNHPGSRPLKGMKLM